MNTDNDVTWLRELLTGHDPAIPGRAVLASPPQRRNRGRQVERVGAALAEAAPEEQHFTDARAALIGVTGGRPSAAKPIERHLRSPRRRWGSPVLIAAAIAALVAGGLIVPTLRWGGHPVNTAVAAELNQAADAAAKVAAAGGDIVPAGGYRYIDSHAWYQSTNMADGEVSFSFLEESRQQIWVPADWHNTWLERRSTTGARKWLLGSEKDAVAAGQPKDNVASTDPDLKGPCANYLTDLCTADGNWEIPTQAWIAGLPTNADDMYDRLYDDAKGHGQSQESEMLVIATDALRTGLLPASVAATLYRAMAQIGGVAISSTAVNLDGQVGTGFTVDSPQLRDETIIDPKTGQFIGTRTTTLHDDSADHLPAGTVIGYTAVHTEIVKALGSTRP